MLYNRNILYNVSLFNKVTVLDFNSRDIPYLQSFWDKLGKIYSTSQKFGHTYSFKVFFLHCRIIVKTSKLWNTYMESCSNQKSAKQIQIYFRFFKVATLCFVDSFAHFWLFLNQLHEECFFQQSWRSSHICWAIVGCFSFTPWSNSSRTISIGLRLGDCGGQVIWCSSPSLSFLVK